MSPGVTVSWRYAGFTRYRVYRSLTVAARYGVHSLRGVPLPYGRGSLWGSLVVRWTGPCRSGRGGGFARCGVSRALTVGARGGVPSFRGVRLPYGRGSLGGSLVTGVPLPYGRGSL